MKEEDGDVVYEWATQEQNPACVADDDNDNEQEKAWVANANEVKKELWLCVAEDLLSVVSE